MFQKQMMQAALSILAVEHSLKCFDASDLATLCSLGRHGAFISAMQLVIACPDKTSRIWTKPSIFPLFFA
jgi:hypothetical protein